MNIYWTRSAENDLAEIFEFLLYKIGLAESLVFKQMDQILQKTDQLSSLPRMGQRELWLDHLPEEYRYLLVKPYKIIYHITEAQIIVDAVFDTRQGIDTLKGKLE